jgi:glycosyltransferase involved in cell wall biosynthesis
LGTSDIQKITVVIPVFNEERVIGSVVEGIREVVGRLGTDYEVLVVDDASTDATKAVAARLGVRVVSHAYNMGNGAAVKTGIRNAEGDIIVLMDGDGQHSPADIPRLLEGMGTHAMVVGARDHDSQAGWHRDWANRAYNAFASYICGIPILDLTSGFRAIRTSLARQYVYLLPNTFSYPTTITLALVRAGHCIKYVPIRAARREGTSKIVPLRDGLRFLAIMLKICTLFSPMRIFVPLSIITLALAAGSYLFTLITFGPKMPPSSVILAIASVQFFIMGLISEQITQLRYTSSERQ